ncbi:MAG: iron ABC transporter substrate-binding protein [Chloroflexi bacterium]|nr:iron ABC transporter substrate-binding protein [Chloroflexota bacterium]
MHHWRLSLLSLVVVVLFATACAGGAPAPSAQPATTKAVEPAQPAASAPAKPAEKVGGTITVYSGREEKLVAPIIERFKKDSGIDVKVRYGDTAELAATILEEGKNSPADVYFAQDAGALGALVAQQALAKLPDSILNRVDARFRAPKGEWVGLSGRARTVVYNTKVLKTEDLPDTLLGFTDAKWKGKIGWSPTNGSFQAFVTALRVTDGDEAARKWLDGIKANTPKAYSNNTGIVKAVGDGEIQVGFVNHYYLFRFIKEQGESFPARNYHPRAGDSGAMINVAGAGILTTAKNPKAAETFVEYLLSKEAQQYFADETFEYPLVEGIKTHPVLVPLSQIKTPKLDLGSLADLDKTLKLLRDTGAL